MVSVPEVVTHKMGFAGGRGFGRCLEGGLEEVQKGFEMKFEINLMRDFFFNNLHLLSFFFF